MATNESLLENCENVNLGTVEYTYIVEGKELPKSFDLKDFYITKLLSKTYRIFKKVQTETEKAVLRYWKAKDREYMNLSWIPKGWGPSGADIERIANGGDDRVVSDGQTEAEVEEGSILYALSNDFRSLADAEANLLRIVEFLSKD
jgi:hypothetical protein